MAGTLSLRQCAERLGVHYMTAYRYVRLGRLPATKVGVEWRVLPSDLEAFLAIAAEPPRRGTTDWSARLEDRLLAGDDSGAWAVVEAALASGVAPSAVHVDLLSPALVRIGEAWSLGTLSVVDEHRATAVAIRIVGRLGPRFWRRGGRRGRILIGTPPGERHSIGVAMVCDLLRGAGWDVFELGVDVPIEAFIVATGKAAPVSAIAVSVACDAHLDGARELIAELRHSVVAPILVGGAAVDSASADSLHADGWASDARSAVEAVAALTA